MVTLEPIVWVIRIGNDNKKMYETYSATCTAIKCGLDTVRITAMVSNSGQPLGLKELISLSNSLKDLGFKFAVWERVKSGKLIENKLELISR